MPRHVHQNLARTPTGFPHMNYSCNIGVRFTAHQVITMVILAVFGMEVLLITSLAVTHTEPSMLAFLC